MAWWRSPAIPASSLVIGNLALDDPNFIFSLQSLIGTLPIVLGDPREIPASQKATIKRWSVWMQEMQEKYDYMNYRRDLKGFGEPREGFWDGWQRINFQTKEGGIFGVFRQGALESSCQLVLNDLDPDKMYYIRKAPESTVLFRKTGSELMNTGISIQLEKEYDAGIFEVGVE